ncbi:Cadherin-like [Bradyrhizobium erythrophlei]|nr:Cadherin-like [Bradyrhizobium erythrophlei]
MKSKLGTELQDDSDFGLKMSEAELNAGFSFSPSFNFVGVPPSDTTSDTTSPVEIPGTPALTSEAVASSSAQSGSISVVSMTAGGITINLLFDAAAMAAPASFRAAIQQAASLLTAAISDKITVNIKIDYSGTGGGAAAGPDNGVYESYSTVKADLVNSATPGDATFNALPSGSSIQGQSSVVVWNAQLKLWGLLGANDTTTDDGSATFATDISSGLLVGVALHELTHAMGRVPYGQPYGPQPDIFDLFRFTSPGTQLIDGHNTTGAAYFSIDGGNTKLADLGQNSDPSDFLNSGVQGPNDPFNEYYTGSTLQSLTTVDKELLDALGFHVSVPDTQAPTIVHDDAQTISAGATQTITSSLLSASDNVSSGAQLHYTVTKAPADGTLLLNGLAASSFTQADIDNGLVSYHETAGGVTSDSFLFTVTDAAGNATGSASFQINITGAPTVPGHAPSDFNADGKSDILWYNDNGTVSIWDSGQMSNAHWISNPGVVPESSHISGTGDFDGNGHSDILWHDANGAVYIWDNGQASGAHTVSAAGAVPSSSHIVGTGDFDGNGHSDILWHDDNGTVFIWDDGQTSGALTAAAAGVVPASWHIAGVGDFDGNGHSDILWQNDNGAVSIWDSGQIGSAHIIANAGVVPNSWHIAGVGDFDGNGHSDILWQNDNGAVSIWGNGQVGSAHIIANAGVVSSSWHIAGVGDFDGNGHADILWHNDNGAVSIWNNGQINNAHVIATISSDWHIA